MQLIGLVSCRIYLMGQSAGAHIAACALVEQAIKEAGEGQDISWSVSQIKAYFGLSGGWVNCLKPYGRPWYFFPLVLIYNYGV